MRYLDSGLNDRGESLEDMFERKREENWNRKNSRVCHFYIDPLVPKPRQSG